MKTALSFKFQTERSLFAMYGMLVCMAAFLIAMLSTRSTTGVAIVIKSWILVTCLLLLVMGGQQCRAIVDGARVLRQQRTPQHLWRAWLRASLSGTTRIWGILVVAGTAPLLLPQSPWQWSSAAALFSATLCLSTLAALSNASVLHRAWAWVIAVGVMLLLLLATLTTGLSEGLDQLTRAPSVVHGLMALSWPLLAYRWISVWQSNYPHTAQPGRRASFGLWKILSAYTRRYTVLTVITQTQIKAPFVQTSPGIALWIACSQVFYVGIAAPQWMAVSWNGKVGPYHLLGLGFLSLISAASLAFKDLHWRQLLAPGGLHQGRLGWHILRSTLVFQMGAVLMFSSLWVAISWFFFDWPLDRNLDAAWKYRVFPLEWLLATLVAINIRSMGAASTAASLAVFTAWVTTLSLMGGGLLLAFGLSPGPTLFLVDTYYVGALLLAAFALILLSNRLWAVRKLLPFLRLS